jgi:hypothetical protein
MKVPSSKFQVPSSKFQVPSSKFQVPSSKFQVPSSKKARARISLELGAWNLELSPSAEDHFSFK